MFFSRKIKNKRGGYVSVPFSLLRKLQFVLLSRYTLKHKGLEFFMYGSAEHIFKHLGKVFMVHNIEGTWSYVYCYKIERSKTDSQKYILHYCYIGENRSVFCLDKKAPLYKPKRITYINL